MVKVAKVMCTLPQYFQQIKIIKCDNAEKHAALFLTFSGILINYMYFKYADLCF